MGLVWKERFPRKRRLRRNFFAPLLIAAVAALSLQACQTVQVWPTEELRRSDPVHVISYKGDALELANCAADGYIIVPYMKDHGIPFFTSLNGQLRVSGIYNKHPTDNIGWEATFKDGVAEIRGAEAKSRNMADWFAEALRACIHEYEGDG